MNQSNRLQRAYIAPVGIFVALLIATVLYFNLRYTAIAAVRENTMNLDTTNAYSYGETLFLTRGCANCHAFAPAASSGDEGPVLTGIASRHDAAYIRLSIVNPNAVIVADCPEEACQPNIMPPFGQILDDIQVDALVAYLMAQE